MKTDFSKKFDKPPSHLFESKPVKPSKNKNSLFKKEKKDVFTKKQHNFKNKSLYQGIEKLDFSGLNNMEQKLSYIN